MSTQETAALIESVNNMTATVAGKMGEIDQKVDQSVEDLNNAFPAKYKEFSSRVHYVDCTSGNDNNDGKSWNSPLKTIKQAIYLGSGAVDHSIYLSFGKHVISELLSCDADNVTFIGLSQSHYPDGTWSESTSSIVHIDKTVQLRAGLFTKLFGGIFFDKLVVTMEGQADSTHSDNCIFRGRGNVSMRIPLIVFDSVNRGIMKVMNDYNPFSSLGAELPQFEGEPAYLVKGDNATCIVNMDRKIDRTTGVNPKFGSVVILS